MQLNTVTKTLKAVLDTSIFKSLGMIRDGFKTSKGDYENTYVLYHTLDESILECKEKQDLCPLKSVISLRRFKTNLLDSVSRNQNIIVYRQRILYFRLSCDLHYQSERY